MPARCRARRAAPGRPGRPARSPAARRARGRGRGAARRGCRRAATRTSAGARASPRRSARSRSGSGRRGRRSASPPRARTSRTAPGSACSAGCACAGCGSSTAARGRDAQHHAHPGRAREVDGLVERLPVVAVRAVVAGVEARWAGASRRAPARRRSSARGCGRCRRRRPPSRRSPLRLHRLGQQQPLVLHPDLEVRGRRRRRDGGGQHEQERAGEDRARPPAAHRGATRASREVSAPHCRRHTPARFGTRVRNCPLRERTVSVVTVVKAPAAGRPVLDLDHLRRRVGGRADLAVDLQPRAAPADPDRQPVGLVGGLGAAVEEAQAGLEARQRRLVDQLVLRHRAHAAVAVGHPVGLVDVAGWSATRTPKMRSGGLVWKPNSV